MYGTITMPCTSGRCLQVRKTCDLLHHVLCPPVLCTSTALAKAKAGEHVGHLLCRQVKRRRALYSQAMPFSHLLGVILLRTRVRRVSRPLPIQAAPFETKTQLPAAISTASFSSPQASATSSISNGSFARNNRRAPDQSTSKAISLIVT
jgi:hypothetical protein